MFSFEEYLSGIQKKKNIPAPLITPGEMFKARQVEYKQYYDKVCRGEVLDRNGNPIWSTDGVIQAYGLKNLTKHIYGHGMDRQSGERALEALFAILQKQTPFNGEFGPIRGASADNENVMQHAYETGKFIIVRSDDKFLADDGSLNVDGIEVILNGSLSVFGKDIAKAFPHIVFRDCYGNQIQ